MRIKRTPESDALLARLLIERHGVTREQIATALDLAGSEGDLLETLHAQGLLSELQVQTIARAYQELIEASAPPPEEPPAAKGHAPSGTPEEPRQPLAKRTISREEAEAAARFLEQRGAVSKESLQRALDLQAQRPEMSLFKVLVSMNELDSETARKLSRTFRSTPRRPSPKPRNRRRSPAIRSPLPQRAAPQHSPANGAPQPHAPMPHAPPPAGAFHAPPHAATYPGSWQAPAPQVGEPPFGPPPHAAQYPYGDPYAAYGYAGGYPRGQNATVALARLARLHRMMCVWFLASLGSLAALMLLAVAVVIPELLLVTGLLIMPVFFFMLTAMVVFSVYYFLTAVELNELFLAILLYVLGLAVFGGVILWISGADKLKRNGMRVGFLGVRPADQPLRGRQRFAESFSARPVR